MSGMRVINIYRRITLFFLFIAPGPNAVLAGQKTAQLHCVYTVRYFENNMSLTPSLHNTLIPSVFKHYSVYHHYYSKIVQNLVPKLLKSMFLFKRHSIKYEFLGVFVKVAHYRREFAATHAHTCVQNVNIELRLQIQTIKLFSIALQTAHYKMQVPI